MSQAKDSVEIKTHIDRRDLIELELFRQLRSGPQRFRRLALALIPAVAVIAAFAWWFIPATSRLTYTPALLLTMPLYLALFYRLTRRRVAARLDLAIAADREHAALGEYLISLSDEGVKSQHGSTEKFYRWDAIVRVLANGDYGYLYTSPEDVLVLPARCFPDGNAFRTFVKLAVIYHWNCESSGAKANESVREPAPLAAQTPIS